MITLNVREEIQHELDVMTDSQLYALLTLLREMNKPALIGEPGWQIIQHAKALDFRKEDVDEMERAIEEFSAQEWEYPDVKFDE
jgi:hypothetical protein